MYYKTKLKKGENQMTTTDYGNMFSEYPDVITVEELQDMLHIGRSAAYGMLNDGTIKARRNGRRYIIPKISVINYVTSIIQ